MIANITFNCELCKKTHTAPRDGALALLQLCKVCATKRYADGKREQKKAGGTGD